MSAAGALQDTDVAVRCQSVTKVFGTGEARVEALRGIDLEVPLGQLTMLVGPSGCGKTTLLSVIAGLLDRTAGEIQVLGVDTTRLSGAAQIEFRRKNLGFVFQQYNLLPALTGAENAAVPLLVAGMARRQAVTRAAELLQELGLGPRGYALPAQLSSGQQQRVAFARALIHAPRLIVCDEPTAALDADSGQRVMEALTQVAVRPDRAVLVVTHDNRIFGFADRIAHMEDGRIVRIETIRKEAAS
jgi:putative ABC transport system ATP-binding protein